MSIGEKHGGPAFPLLETSQTIGSDGMTVREYAAIHIAAGFAAKMRHDNVFDLSNGVKGGATEAIAAVVLADRLIEELRK